MATAPKEAPAERSEGYQLEGTLLEVCSCDVLCPCWIGEDPDGGDLRVGHRLPLRHAARSAASTSAA